MVAPRWRSVTLPVATMSRSWSPTMRSASRNLALSRSGRVGAMRSSRSTLSRKPSASCAHAMPGWSATTRAAASVRMRLCLKGMRGAGARMNGEGYTQNPAPLHPMDDRFSALQDWLREPLAGAPFRLEKASSDASFRRYFRVFLEDRTLIAMDAPPEREDSAAFVRVAGLLREAGLNAPAIFAYDLRLGFLLVTDLGTCSYLEALRGGDVDALFGDATTALAKWQAATRPGVLPDYDEPLLRREMQLFPDWYVAKHLGVELSPAQRSELESVFRRVLQNNLAQARVFVHRDYMPRNLMVSDPNPGILDFQDAVHGPVSYD